MNFTRAIIINTYINDSILQECESRTWIELFNVPWRAVCVSRPKFAVLSVCAGKRAMENFFHANATRRLPLFIARDTRHTCHARLLAFVSGLTNGPPHMARRARLRPDFGPAASPPSFVSHRSLPAEPSPVPAPCWFDASRRIRVLLISLTRISLTLGHFYTYFLQTAVNHTRDSSDC